MTDDPARSRFFIISLTRLAGAVLAVVGLVASSGRWPDIPPVAGIPMTLAGVLGFAIAPRLLARRWRSPE